MDIILYKNTAPPNKINKKSNLKNKLDVESVRFLEKGALDILRPTVLCNLGDEISEVAKYNYLYIPKFNRYYFITDIKAEGGLIRIEGECDVLFSHMKDIMNSTQYIIRNEHLRSPYLVDAEIPIRSDKKYFQTVFGNNVDVKSCPYVILETTGKGGRIVP